MSLETGESAEATEAVSTESSSGSGSGYSVTDPGYEMEVASDSVDALAELKAENTKETKPAATAADASDTDSGEAEETVEKPADESADSEISDELLDKATELGYTLDELKGFRSTKALERDIARVEKLQQRFQSRQAEKKPATETAPVEESEPEPKWDEMIEEGHDPANVAIQKQLWQRAAKAEAAVKQVMQAEQNRIWEAMCERFDSTLNNMGEEYKELFGNGRRGDLLKSSPELAANRDRVFDQMAILRAGYQAAGKTIPSEPDLINEAVQSSFYKQTQQIARKALKAEIKKAGSQSLSRPHSTGTKPMSGESRALAKEQEFWKQHS